MKNSSTGIPACAHVTTEDDRDARAPAGHRPLRLFRSRGTACRTRARGLAQHPPFIFDRLSPFCKEAPIGLASKSNALQNNMKTKSTSNNRLRPSRTKAAQKS